MDMGISFGTDRLLSSQFLAAAPKIMDLERSRYTKPPRFTLAQVAETINRLEEEMSVHQISFEHRKSGALLDLLGFFRGVITLLNPFLDLHRVL
jgi:hypothetical protein